MRVRASVKSVVRHLDGLSPVRSFLLVVAVLAVVYVPTATWSSDLNVDVDAAVGPAWRLGTHGDVYVENLHWNPWYITVGQHQVSNRPPGVVFWAAPWYALFQDLSHPTVWQSTAAALAATLLAMGFLHLGLRRITTPLLAISATLVMGLGTATWPVSSDQLWSHGPAQLWVALGLLALSYDMSFTSGLAFGLGLLTRPPVAFLAAGTGIAWGWLRRSWRRFLLLGVGTLLGLVGLIAYNQAVFSTLAIRGGYPDTFTQRLLSLPWSEYARNVAGAFLDPNNGLLIWSSFLILLLPGLASAWRTAPVWVKSSAVGGLVYLLLHLRMNRFSGGMPFDYRYPLEALVAMTPLLLLSYTQWVQERPMLRRIFFVTVVLSVVAQGMVATALYCVPQDVGNAICSFF